MKTMYQAGKTVYDSFGRSRFCRLECLAMFDVSQKVRSSASPLCLVVRLFRVERSERRDSFSWKNLKKIFHAHI